MAERPARSLRTRVAVASALGTVLLAVVVAALVSALLARREVALLDQRLQVVGQAVADRVTAGADPADLFGRGTPLLRASLDGLVVTVRAPSGTTSTGLDGPAADLPARDGDAGGYRVRTLTAGPDQVTVGLPTRPTDRSIARVRATAVLLAGLATLAAGGLGWVLAGPVSRPLRELAARTAALGARTGPAEAAALGAGPVGRVRETAELAGALQGLLARVEQARADGDQALGAARDFAAAAEHELRTPLSAMGTDVEVLRAHPDLPPAQRDEVLAELAGAQRRLTATLAALGQLAAGDLAPAAGAEGVELTDLVASAVAAVARSVPAGVEVGTGLPAGEVRVPGDPAGVRLAVDNLLANALRHADAGRVVAAVHPVGDRVQVVVDDDGRGVPADERAAVFERFRRGTGTRAPGSGLGLALVAQQARRHGGAAWLTDAPLGGTRAVLELPATGPSSPGTAAG